MDPVIEIIMRMGAVGALGGLIGGLLGSSRAGILGSMVMGALGGISGSAILRIGGAPAIYDAGQGFSYVYALGSGLLLGFVVSASNK